MKPCACCKARPGVIPWSLTSNVHDLLCGRCAARWESSPEAGLHAQLVRLGQAAMALSQFESWKATARRAA